MFERHILLLIITVILIIFYILCEFLLRSNDHFAKSGIETEARIVYLESSADGEDTIPTVSFHANNRMIVGKPVYVSGLYIPPESISIRIIYNPYEPEIFVVKRAYRINGRLIWGIVVVWLILYDFIYK